MLMRDSADSIEVLKADVERGVDERADYVALGCLDPELLTSVVFFASEVDVFWGQFCYPLSSVSENPSLVQDEARKDRFVSRSVCPLSLTYIVIILKKVFSPIRLVRSILSRTERAHDQEPRTRKTNTFPTCLTACWPILLSPTIFPFSAR